MPALLSSTTSLLGTVHPDGYLSQLSVKVTFLGRLPETINVENIPIQIAISIPHELGVHAHPILQLDTQGTTVDNAIMRLSIKEQAEIRDTIAHVPSPPFVPLPATFRPLDDNGWIKLYHSIATWMTWHLEVGSLAWVWARDAYWIAFVGAHPEFPGGKWPSWDSAVGLDGVFICRWMERRSVGLDGWNGPVHSIVWEEMDARFRQHVSFLL
ncbi:hypothetical protein C8Q76DRAFT_800838 [Earliella scabrosa]|nr:hypothetical protein C8Q76DRAFT_800838 [Earliella scabrosa]